jgi:thiosulfate/3-mercaptopyruvate sulfurtransferase
MKTIISTAELDRCRSDTDVVIFDASYYLPTESTDAHARFTEAHIPGADFFDVEVISDRTSSLPHMVPQADHFADMVATFGVSARSKIVVYDQRGLFSAARAWWLFILFGHEDVQVLDGGLPKWRAEGRELENGSTPVKSRGSFEPTFRPELRRQRADIESNLISKIEIVLDARSSSRFNGTVAEPRPGMRSGHVPGAVSLPFSDILTPEHTMKSPDELRALFMRCGVGPASKPITMCGSGITGAVLTLGLARAGLPIGALYDGSWAEWGGASDTPIERSV